MTEAPGAKMLKIVSILFVIFGGWGVIAGLMACGGASLITASLSILGVGTGVLWVTIIVAIVLAVLGLIMGIVGLLWSNKTEKAGLLTTLGIAYIALLVVRTVFDFIFASSLNVGLGAFAWVGLIVGLVLPVLYILGAKKNMAVK
ncbi:MAG: hypothetical protein FWE04_05135 [Oscillospiraceae bacterium]|nr:hypothetical protein [Oscillospiraceae bacterium]